MSVPDVEMYVFTAVKNAIDASHSGVFTSGEYLQMPDKFPAVYIVQQDSYNHTDSIDFDGTHADRLMYEVNVYSNKKSGRKQQCSQIMATVDAKLQELGFIRTSRMPISTPNLEPNIYRLTARYRTIITEDLDTFRG